MIFEEINGEVLTRLGREKERDIDAVPTPFPSWNNVCGEEGGRVGLAKKWMVVLAGVDGGGKSYLGYNLTANAVLEGKLVGGINFEMSQMQAATRYVSILTGHPRYMLEQGKHYDPSLWRQACKEVDEIADRTGGAFIINQAAVFDLEDINKAYAELAEAGVEMVVLDYAQLVHVKGKDGIFQRSEEVANTLRALSHKHNVLSVVLSQFNRETKNSDSPPTRHGLQGGSAWENNANQIILIDHTMQVKTRDGTGKYTRLIGDKNRHGPSPWMLPMKWTFDTMRATEYVPGTEPGDPFPQEGEEDGEVRVERKGAFFEGDTDDNEEEIGE